LNATQNMPARFILNCSCCCVPPCGRRAQLRSASCMGRRCQKNPFWADGLYPQERQPMLGRTVALRRIFQGDTPLARTRKHACAVCFGWISCRCRMEIQIIKVSYKTRLTTRLEKPRSCERNGTEPNLSRNIYSSDARKISEEAVGRDEPTRKTVSRITSSCSEIPQDF
jgi:hypothetical protein